MKKLLIALLLTACSVEVSVQPPTEQDPVQDNTPVPGPGKGGTPCAPILEVVDGMLQLTGWLCEGPSPHRMPTDEELLTLEQELEQFNSGIIQP